MRSRPRSLRDIAIANNAADRYYAAMFGKEPQFQTAVKPKRAASVPDPTIPSEHQLQSAVISWWALACNKYSLPHFALFAIPNGGARDMITGARLKAEGVRPGILDLMLAVMRRGHGGLFIEMKKGDNKPSPVQKEVMEYLQGAGYAREVCWTSQSAIDAITAYLRT